MKYLAAYCLLNLGGNESPSVEDIQKFFKDIGFEADDNQIKAVIEHLKGKELHQLCQEGSTKLGATVGGSGGSGEKKEEAA